MYLEGQRKLELEQQQQKEAAAAQSREIERQSQLIQETEKDHQISTRNDSSGPSGGTTASLTGSCKKDSPGQCGTAMALGQTNVGHNKGTPPSLQR